MQTMPSTIFFTILQMRKLGHRGTKMDPRYRAGKRHSQERGPREARAKSVLSAMPPYVLLRRASFCLGVSSVREQAEGEGSWRGHSR